MKSLHIRFYSKLLEESKILNYIIYFVSIICGFGAVLAFVGKLFTLQISLFSMLFPVILALSFVLGRYGQNIVQSIRADFVVFVCTLFILGFRSNHLAGGIDPGMYINVGNYFSRTGTLVIDWSPPAISGLAIEEWTPGAILPGLWAGPGVGQLHSQFFDFWPSILAILNGVAHLNLGYAVTPALGALAATLIFIIIRSQINLSFALKAQVLVSTNMALVWQANYPTTESLQLVLVLLAILFLTDRTNSLFSLSWLMYIGLNRLDGLLLVALLMPATLKKFIETPKSQVRKISTLLFMLLLAFFIYAQDFSFHRDYTLSQFSFSLKYFVLLVILFFVYGWAVSLRTYQERNWIQRVLVLIFLVLTAGMSMRPLFEYQSKIAWGISDFDPDNWNIPILILLCTIPVVIAFISLLIDNKKFQEWDIKTVFVLLIPLLLVQLLTSGITPRLMWWIRRYTWLVIPIIILGGLFYIGKHYLSKIPIRHNLALTALILSTGLTLFMSHNLFGFTQFGGFNSILQKVNDAIPSESVVVFERDACCTNPGWTLATPLFLSEGRKILISSEEAINLFPLNSEGKLRKDLFFILSREPKGYSCQDFTGIITLWTEQYPLIPLNSRGVAYPVFVCQVQG
jgi:hypothetical protein